MPVPESIAELRRSEVADAVRHHRLVAILRRVSPRERLLEIADGLAEAGVRIFEVTFDADSAADDLVAIRERLGGAGEPAHVGAGTIRTPAQLRRALDAGAAFGVSPVTDREVLEAALDAGLPFVPGAYTPTEADAAWRVGATFVKLFPGSSLGPAHVRELRGPLPEIETIVTGGVDASNARSFLEAGAVAVGIGSALVAASPEGRRMIVVAVGGPR